MIGRKIPASSPEPSRTTTGGCSREARKRLATLKSVRSTTSRIRRARRRRLHLGTPPRISCSPRSPSRRSGMSAGASISRESGSRRVLPKCLPLYTLIEICVDAPAARETRKICIRWTSGRSSQIGFCGELEMFTRKGDPGGFGTLDISPTSFSARDLTHPLIAPRRRAARHHLPGPDAGPSARIPCTALPGLLDGQS